jgi:hypothetical protein
MRREYSDRQKVDGLLTWEANGRNLSETHRKTGIPVSTLHRWSRENRGVNADIVAEVERGKVLLADKCDEIAHRAADLLPGKLPEASVRDLVGAVKIMVDSAQSLRSQPTLPAASADLDARAILALVRAVLFPDAPPIDITPRKPQTSP